MHGLQHDSLKNMIQKTYGLEKWAEFLECANASEAADFAILRYHHDDVTYHLLEKTAEFFKITMGQVLEMQGRNFFHYAYANGYGEMLESAGRDLEQFLSNLDFQHFFISSYIYGSVKNPSFRCERPDPADPDTLHLHYISKRSGYYPYVMGLTRECAKELYNVTADISVVSLEQPEYIADGDADTVRYHTLFLIHQTHNKPPLDDDDDFEDDSEQATPTPRRMTVTSELDSLDPNGGEASSRSSSLVSIIDSFQLSAADFCRLHPFHIAFDNNMVVVSVGHHLSHQLKSIRPGRRMMDCVRIVHPQTTLKWSSIMLFTHAQFVLQVLKRKRKKKLLPIVHEEEQPMLLLEQTMDDGDEFESKQAVRKLEERDFDLELKGQMFTTVTTTVLVFIGSPNARSLTELSTSQIFLSDIPLHDVTREMTLLNQQRLAEVELSKQLEITTSELKTVSRQLETEKAKIDDLLQEMLPKQIADSLKEGREVQACQYDLVSILFADIVKFTVISSHCQPIKIVDLLNELFTLFDDMCTRLEVYKVETIGDAYMIAGGIPTPTKDHCERVAEAALEMRRLCVTVNSPSDGKPINIRVGIHCGPVMAGVVGRKMPRYCLFGDTVNTASRMESHGVASKVHVSAEMKKHLEGKPFIVQYRGEMEVKGKGMLKTYFVEGKLEKPPTALTMIALDNMKPQSTNPIASTSFFKRFITCEQTESSVCALM